MQKTQVIRKYILDMLGLQVEGIMRIIQLQDIKRSIE